MTVSKARETTETILFRRRLRALHLKAGRPSNRTMAEVLACNPSWFSQLFQGPALSDWDRVSTVVKYLDGDLDEFRPLWDAAVLSRTERHPDAAGPVPVLTDVDGRRIDQVMTLQDACLIALEDGRTPPPEALDKLPTWRAELVRSLAEQLGLIDQDDQDDDDGA